MYETIDDTAFEYLKNYIVTEDGDVISRKTSKPMKTELNDNGYRRVALSKNGVYRKFLVHRLVMLWFVGASNGMAVNHKDGDRLNNRLNNLEYVTLQDNLRHYWDAGKFHNRIVMTQQAANEARVEYHTTKIKVKELAAKYGVSGRYMCDILNNEHWADPAYTRTRVFRRPWAKKGSVA